MKTDLFTIFKLLPLLPCISEGNHRSLELPGPLYSNMAHSSCRGRFTRALRHLLHLTRCPPFFFSASTHIFGHSSPLHEQHRILLSGSILSTKLVGIITELYIQILTDLVPMITPVMCKILVRYRIMEKVSCTEETQMRGHTLKTLNIYL